MNDLEINYFSISEQNETLKDYYSFFLNELLKEKKRTKYTSRILAKAFKCSIGKISDFETRKKDLDFEMLMNYCGFFNYEIGFIFRKMSYNEVKCKQMN
jgi:hypothetical protein